MGAQRNRLMALGFAFLACTVLSACNPGGEGQSGQTASVGEAQIGGPFQLVDQEGKPRDQTLLKGKWSAVFFGYTYCPDVCPTTLQTLARAKALMGGAAQDLQVVFVSVDPGRDTPAQLKSYLETPVFPQPSIGLTGSPDQVAAAAKAYRVFYQKQGQGDGYTVNHSSIIYLMNPRGKFDRVLSESQTAEEMAGQIGDAMKGKA